jgi:hypothetical protein
MFNRDAFFLARLVNGSLVGQRAISELALVSVTFRPVADRLLAASREERQSIWDHLFVSGPHDPTGRRVLVLDNGGNVAPPAPTLAYVIEDRGSGARVEWIDEPVAITAGQSLRPLPKIADDKVVGGRECKQWLSDFLTDGPKPSSEVFKAAVAVGYSRDQVKDAKQRMGAVAQRHGFQEGAYQVG